MIHSSLLKPLSLATPCSCSFLEKTLAALAGSAARVFLSWPGRSAVFGRSFRLLPISFVLLGLLASTALGWEKEKLTKKRAIKPLPAEWLNGLRWRSIGPANMSGRIVSLSVYEKDPNIWWVATASGGLVKTTNNGVTFHHQFDHENTVSIGDVCVAPSNPEIVWVGTGEHNPRNSVSYGDGVYRSIDGGKTWKHMGLKKSFQIGRIAIHPTNPNIVYVGAMGRLYGPNTERGLFKTTDGGKTWNKILYVDDTTGVIEVQMHPNKPDTLLVATWECQRDAFDGGDPVKKWGPGSGLHKTTDGGKTWKKITKGLPTCRLGRIGIDYFRKDPTIAYAIVDSEKVGQGGTNAYMGILGTNAVDGARLTRVLPGGPSNKAGLRVGDVVMKIDDKVIKNYRDLIASIRTHKGGDKVKVKVVRGNKPRTIPLTFGTRLAFRTRLGGQRANAQSRQGKKGFQTGGVFKSTDGGDSWKRVNSLNPRPMYFSQIRVDPSDANRVHVLGIFLAVSTDGGQTFRTATRGIHPDQHALWIDPRDGRHMIVGTDGGFYVTYDRMRTWDHFNHLAIGQFYHVAVSPRRDYRVYGGLQDNGSWGGPSRTSTRVGPINENWFSVGGGDGFTCLVAPADPDVVYSTMQYGGMRRLDLRTGVTVFLRPRGRGYRFNWNTPFILSHKNPRVFYCAGNYVFRSIDRGNDLKKISPLIGRTERGTGTALAESPQNPDVLWVGTDDGVLRVTRDGGINWTDVIRHGGLPGPRWVSTIEASRFSEGRAYVCFDGHRSNDDRPLLYVTEDYGKTWKAIHANLPWGSTRCLREDLTNPDLLYCGTEFAVFASLDRGQSWTKINNNLPTVAVHELTLHPTVPEMVAATHGRSLWILDVSALRQMKRGDLENTSRLYVPEPPRRPVYRVRPGRSSRQFVGENPPEGAVLYYSLPTKAKRVTLAITDTADQTVRQLRGATTAGLHRLIWDLRRAGRRIGRRSRRGRPVPPGKYTMRLTVDGKDVGKQTLEVKE